MITPLELLNLYFSDGASLGNKESKLWRRFNELLSWNAILNKGYQADLCPLLYYILTKWKPGFRNQVLGFRNALNVTNVPNAPNAPNALTPCALRSAPNPVSYEL